MRLVLSALFVSLLSISVFAETVYVRAPKGDDSVTVEQKNSVRDAVKQALKDRGDKIATRPSEAKISYLPTISRSDAGYTIEIQKFTGKKSGAKNEASGEDINDVAKQAVAGFANEKVSRPVIAAALPEKTVDTTTSSEPQEAAPAPPAPRAEADVARHWYVALGPDIANSLVGVNGTKYSIDIGYNQALNENLDLLYFYDGNFNTGSQGSTAVSTIGAGLRYLPAARIADHSPFLRIDADYGGGNKLNDAGVVGGIAIGYDFFRQGNMSFEVILREMALLTTGQTAIAAWPSITQLMVGIYF